MKKTALILGYCLAAVLPCASDAQEALETILDRGYVAHWLVCGPFESRLEEGITGAMAAGKAPLGYHDYMEPVGGISRLRPEHLQVVPSGEGQALWQRAGTTDHTLDLAPFFPEEDTGVAYAAFYTRTDRRRAVFFNLQTALGARVWLNGYPLVDIRAEPVVSAGTDRFIAVMRPGVNLVVMEIPGATFATLAEAAGMTMRELRMRGFRERPLLNGSSGFEMALEVRPALPLGDLYYVPRLESTGTFSGMAGDVRQDTELFIYNNSGLPSSTVEVVAAMPTMKEPVVRRTSRIAPDSLWKPVIPVATGGYEAGRAVPVEVRILAGENTEGERFASFNASVNVRERNKGGRFYFITGQEYLPARPEDQAARMARWIHSFRNQMKLHANEQEYGFDLGETAEWKAAFTAAPDLRDALIQAVGTARCAVRAGFASPDQRLVSGHTLSRNLEYGLLSSRGVLDGRNQVFFARDQRGLAPQLPQILSDAGLAGVLSALPVAGLPGLFAHEGPDTSRVFHRRRKADPGPATIEELRQDVAVKRRELLQAGITVDLTVNESTVPPPEPLFFGAARELARSWPAILVEAGGAKVFFEELAVLPPAVAENIPVTARLMTTAEPGSVLAQRELKQVHTRLEDRLFTAEAFATFAALYGAEWPETALNAAWRQVLYWSAPDRLGMAATGRVYADALAGYRDAAELSGEVIRKSLEYIAGETNTLNSAPNDTGGVRALMVFNPSAQPRSDICEIELNPGRAPGLRLIDNFGNPVSFLPDRIRRTDTQYLSRLRVRFPAKNIPSLGCRTYYVIPEGMLPEASERRDPQIENDFFLIIADSENGNIMSLVDKRTGADIAAGPLNRMLLLEEDPGRMAEGRELWTTGDYAASDIGPASFRTRVMDWTQILEITTPFKGGRLIRTLQIYNGISRIDCTARLEGVTIEDALLAAAFQPPHAGRSPVYGERYGAVTGRRSAGILDYQSRDIDNVSGHGAQPALHWAALAPGDVIQAGAKQVVPLAPAVIIHGADPELEKAARTLESAFISRGIPAAISPDEKEKPDFLWSDSTEFPDFESDISHGAAMHVVIGSPEQNRFCSRLAADMEADTARLFTGRLQQGLALLLADEHVPEGYPPLPTLVFAGMTPARSAELANFAAENLETRGNIAIPPSASVDGIEVPRPEDGLALFFEGPALCSVEQDGALILGLRHKAGKRTAPDAELLPEEDRIEFRYALYPFSGNWRDAGLARAAEAWRRPLTGLVTDLHQGNHPDTLSFLGLDEKSLLVSSVRPAMRSAAEMSRRNTHPRDGIAVEVYETQGRSAQGSLTLYPQIRDAARTDFTGQRGASLPGRNGSVNIAMAPWGVDRFWLLPAVIKPGETAKTGRETSPYGASPTRYWLHNTGAAPIGWQPLSIVITGNPLSGEVTIHVADNRSEGGAIEGVADITAAEGWSAGPARFYYRLQPGQVHAEAITVLRTATDSRSGETGGMAVSTEQFGQTFRDVVSLMEDPLTLVVKRNEAQLNITVRNSSGIPAEGFVDVITPAEFWPELGESPESTLLPRRAAVSVPPYGLQNILFRFSSPDARPWTVVKLAANGHLVYKKIPGAQGALPEPPGPRTQSP
jgi:alpha-mannosidase